ncbi:hypothetical protein HDU96_006408 [Phlyctochytrium bullatum]|nr:hypothetical protein HDU96_006408 [Phlyctochytrium bullatum]
MPEDNRELEEPKVSGIDVVASCGIASKFSDRSGVQVEAEEDVTCQYCSEELKADLLAAHLAECPEFPATCPHLRYGCSWTGARSTLTPSHLPECPYEAIAPFFQLFEQQAELIQQLQEELIQHREETALERADIAFENDDIRRQIGVLSDGVVGGASPLPNGPGIGVQPLAVELGRLRMDLDAARTAWIEQTEASKQSQLDFVDARIREAVAASAAEHQAHAAKLARESTMLREEVQFLKAELTTTRHEMHQMRLMMKAMQIQIAHMPLPAKDEGGNRSRSAGRAKDPPPGDGGAEQPKRTRSTSSGELPGTEGKGGMKL